eukprot:6190212-Pleurochrysis_carterae.AAC.3
MRVAFQILSKSPSSKCMTGLSLELYQTNPVLKSLKDPFKIAKILCVRPSISFVGTLDAMRLSYYADRHSRTTKLPVHFRHSRQHQASTSFTSDDFFESSVGLL